MGAWHYAERHMTSFTLKVVACCCMVVDHIATFIPGMPLWMHWIGRLSSPLFIFLIGWSCEFTHDRKRYLTRLYAAGVLMAFVQGALNIPNNIFICLFQIALIITLLSADSARDRLRNIALYAAYQLALIPIFWYVISPLQLPSMASAVIVAASGTVVGLSGGLFYVVLGVAMWAVRENRIRLSAVYLGLNLLFALALSPIGARVVLGLEHHANLAFGVQGVFLVDNVLRLLSIDFMSVGGSALTVNYQWMMVLALPLMLLYNRRRGPGVKWFFYAFYPAHIVALYGIGMALGGAA